MSMRTFSVKNFEKFQHYKDRAPPWIKLYNELLDDYAFGKLADASKFHLIAIWLLASRSGNVIPYDADWVGKRINAMSPVDLDIVSQAGFIIVNQEVQKAEQVASATLAECPNLWEPERETEGETETEVEVEKESRVPAAALKVEFDERFWTTYPNKVGKPKALEAFLKARRKVSLELILAGLELYRNKKDDRAWCNPATWLNQERWGDEPAIGGSYEKSSRGSVVEASHRLDEAIDAGFGLPPLPI